MRILVTGGAGFIGRSLVDDLLARGVEARVFDKTLAGLAELKNPALELIEEVYRRPASRSAGSEGYRCYLPLS